MLLYNTGSRYIPSCTINILLVYNRQGRMALTQSAVCQIYLVLAIASFTTNSSRVYCPPNVKVERGENITISCSHNGSAPSASYWYKGDPSRGGPILRMAEGKPGGIEYQKGHYDITSTAAMVIQNAAVEDESIYWFLAYLDDGEFEKHNFTINVTVTPSRPCPVIDVCSSCEVCSMTINKTGSLKCSVTESRPKVTLNWVVKNAKEIEFLKPTVTTEQDFTTATWNTTIEISYVAPSCNQHVVLQCVAQDSLNILQHWDSSVEMYTGNCSTDTLGINNSSSRVKMITTFVASSVLLMTVLVIAFVLYTKSKQNAGYKRGETTSDELSTGVQSPMKGKMPKEVSGMVSQLKECYRSYCFYKVLPWESLIPVDRLYTNCQCTVSFADGDSLSCKSNELLDNARIKRQRKVFITGDMGCGKTILLLQLVKRWVDDEDADYILIFASVSGTTKDMSITDIIRTSPLGEIALDIQDLEVAIRKYKCLIILDGLEEIFLDIDENAGNAENKQCKEDGKTESSHMSLTIQDKISPSNNFFRNMSIWIAIRDGDHCHKTNGCKIRLNQFSDEQIEGYIKKSYLNYVQSGKPISCRKDANDHYSDDEEGGNQEMDKQNSSSKEEKECLIQQPCQGSNGEMGSDYHDKVCKKVFRFLEQYDLINGFRKIAAYLVIIVHVTLTKFALAFPYEEDVSTWNRAALMDDVVQSLIANFSKGIVVKQDTIDIIRLRQSLEDESLQLIFENTSYTNTHSSAHVDDKKIKQDAENDFLGDSSSNQSTNMLQKHQKGSSTTEMKLFLQYFQDYLAACSILKYQHNFLQQFKEKVLKRKNEKIFGFLKFISNSERSYLIEICDSFMKVGWYNNVIDCLYEFGLDQDVEEKILRNFSSKHIRFFDLQKNYHGNALLSFCQKCKDRNVKLGKISCDGEFTPKCLEALTVCSYKRIDFLKKHFKAEEFVSILRQMTKKNDVKEIRFLGCTVEDVSDRAEDIKNLKGLRPTVFKREINNDSILQKFNYETLKWEIGKFGSTRPTAKHGSGYAVLSSRIFLVTSRTHEYKNRTAFFEFHL